MTTTLPVRVEGDVEGQVIGYAGGILQVRIPRAFPPGRPLQCEVDANPPMALKGRTIGSKKQPEEDFVVRLRLTNLLKAHRALLEETFG